MSSHDYCASRREDVRGADCGSILWANISRVDPDDAGRMLLAGAVTGRVGPGELACVIGAPDSGAAHLMEVLGGRAGTSGGYLRVNGSAENVAARVCYVPPTDELLPTLTVEETVRFAVRTRTRLPPQEAEQRVHDAVHSLGLGSCARSLVGNAVLRGISGGEKRRLSTAVELACAQRAFVACEPTSGLDSSTALTVVARLRELADGGAAVVMTLSQASAELMTYFDRIIVMSRRACVYCGPADKAVPYFESIGYANAPGRGVVEFLEAISSDPAVHYHGPPPAGAAPRPSAGPPATAGAAAEAPRTVALRSISRTASFTPCKVEPGVPAARYLRVGMQPVTDPSDAECASTVAMHTRLVEAYPRSRFYDDAAAKASSKPHPAAAPRGAERYAAGEHRSSEAARAGLLTQTAAAVHRQWLVTVRNWPVLALRWGQALLVAVMLGGLYWQLGDDQDGWFQRYSAVFFLMAYSGMSNLGIVPVMCGQRRIYARERQASAYRPAAFHVSLVTSELPVSLLETLVLATVMYPMVGLRGGVGGADFWFFAHQLFALRLTTWTFSLLCAIVSPTAAIAQAVVPTLLAFFLLFSGFMVPRAHIPSGWGLAFHGSLFSYPFRAIMTNELSGLTFRCGPSGGVCAGAACACPVETGAQALARYNMEGASSGADALVIYAHLAFYQMLVFLALSRVRAAAAAPSVPLRADSGAHEGDGTCSLLRSHVKSLAPSAAAAPGSKRRASVVSSHASSEGLLAAAGAAAARRRGSSGACMGVTLSFEGLRYTTRGGRVLLDNVTGHLEPGTFVALLGPSGAGKSTLLDLLAGFKSSGRLDGTVLVDGRPATSRLRRVFGYVEQSSERRDTSTVREEIELAARLRVQGASERDVSERVDRVLGELGLADVQHRRVGVTGSGGLPAETRKRLDIAVELVTDPGVIFLDEPTTSLDSAGAFEIAEICRRLAHHHGRTVVATVHQPSTDVVSLFDRVLLLQQGGRVAFSGDVDGVGAHFSRCGWPEPRAGANLATYALEALRYDEGQRAADMWASSALCAADRQEGRRVASLARETSVPLEERFGSAYASGRARQYAVLTRRWAVHFSRDMVSLGVRIGATVFIAAVIGTLWFRLGSGVTDAQSRMTAAFFAILFAAFYATLNIPALVAERAPRFRERHTGTYALLPDYLARATAEAPLLLAQALLFSALVYPLAGLNGGAFFTYFACFWLLTEVSTAFTQLITAVSPFSEFATVVNVGFLAAFMLFAGYLVPRDSMAAGWEPMYRASFFTPGLAVFCAAELDGFAVRCLADELVRVPLFDPASPGACAGAAPTDESCYSSACTAATGNDLLAQFSMEPDDVPGHFATLIAFFVAFRALAYLVMRTIEHVKR